MSKLLDCRYRSGDRSAMQLSADLDQGWRDLGGAWGFDDSGFLNYEIGSKFQCRLRFVAKAPEGWESRTKFPVSEYLTRLALGNNVVAIHGPRLMVSVPLDQPWGPEPEHPSIYEAEPALYAADTSDGRIEYGLEVWVSLEGASRKFVLDNSEAGRGWIWTGNQAEPAIRRG